MSSKIVLGLPNGYWDCTRTFLDEFLDCARIGIVLGLFLMNSKIVLGLPNGYLD